jgi:hypothetical protein
MPSSQGIDPAVLVALLLAANIGVVTAVFLAMARLTGWKRLAAAYPARPPAQDARTGLGSAFFYTMGNYNGCVRWHADDEYLHLALIRPFQWLGHPPMSVPWAAIEVDLTQSRDGYQQVYIDGIPVRLPFKAVEAELELRRAMSREEDPEPTPA